MKKYLILILYVLYSVVGYGQVAPNKDRNRVLNPALSDEFNGTSVDTVKWKTDNVFAWFAKTHWWNVTIEDITRNNSNGNNIGVQPNRMLRLKCESLPPYQSGYGSSGGIETKAHNYLYGYSQL
ncbi:MAG: hypothetical protein FWG84_08300 [Bacteroidales bacterium]|nr:hypothetical protein [Bacteroidales bacterium]